jgi:hypothetical protein
MDKRPIEALKKDSPWELWDWGEVPTDVVWGSWYLPPRDWRIPQGAIAEISKIILDQHVGTQLLGQRLAHVEMMTERGAEVVLTDMPEEKEEVCLKKKTLLDRLLRR